MIDRRRRHLTDVRRWRRRIDQIRASMPPTDPDVSRHVVRLLLVVPPDCSHQDPEVREIATRLGVTVHGGRIDRDGRVVETPSRPWQRARAAGHTGDGPALMWEEVAYERVIEPLYQGQLVTTGRVLRPWTRDDAAYGAVALPHVVRVLEPAHAEVHLLQQGGGQVTHAALVHRGRQLSSDQVQPRVHEDPDAAEAPVHDGVALIALPSGTWNIEVHACGEGVVLGGALIVGHLVERERHRRYHLTG